jgi:hypothetical protein
MISLAALLHECTSAEQGPDSSLQARQPNQLYRPVLGEAGGESRSPYAPEPLQNSLENLKIVLF